MSQNDASLDQLVSVAAGGDQTALGSLLMHFHDPLLEFISKSMPRRWLRVITAEDVLQETLIEAFAGINSLVPQGHAAFFKWLKTIARHRLINQIKRHQALKRGNGRVVDTRRRVESSAATSILGRIAGPGPTPSVVVRQREAIEAVRSALRKCDPIVRQVMLLRFGQGLEISELARRMNRTEGAIKMIIHRAIKDLRVDVNRYLG